MRHEQTRDIGFPPASPGLETSLFFHSFSGLMNGCERNLGSWRSPQALLGNSPKYPALEPRCESSSQISHSNSV